MAQSVGDHGVGLVQPSETRSWSAGAARNLRRHETLLWWVHSAWAFLFGLGVMVLGASNPDYVRIIVFHVLFIWLSSFFLPVLLGRPWLDGKWRERVRLLINYLNKNFYQQLLFFVIPIYYASTTFWSVNVCFLVLVSLSAIVSTLDIVYDRYLSVKWPLAAVYLSFNAFASLNVMLLLTWAIHHQTALYLSALGALAVLASMLYRFVALDRRFWYLLGICLLPLCLLVRFGAGLVPPVTLTLGDVVFGRSVQRLQVALPLSEMPAAFQGPLAVLTPVKAPFGMVGEVRHIWYLDGRMVHATNKHRLDGGRKEGFRYWSSLTIKPGAVPRRVRVDVETGSGQLIGQAWLHQSESSRHGENTGRIPGGP